jgi:RNA polymerase sigma-70 factor (ECF subfamily)
MSAEATAYFPDALSNTQVRPTDHSSGDAVSPLAPGAESIKNHRFALECDSGESDESLLEEVGLGNRDALSQLFRRHARTVRNVARRILRHDAEADDLVQDVFVFLVRKASLFKASHGTALSWIIQVTYHRAFDRRRHLNTRHFYKERDIEEVALAASQRQTEAYFAEWSLEGVWGKETASRLRESLSPSQLTTIELYFFEGYTLGEIADRLGQTLGNVQHHYYRALEKLRRPDFADKLRSK